MKLYNTETRKIEDFIPWEEGKVKLYTCGPTVYHYAHIGNLRTYITEDILDKTFRYLGYDVLRVMNITDVGHLTSDADTGDDKMVKRASEEKKSVMDIAKYYTDAFYEDMNKLNLRMPDIVSPATAHIDDYIKIIEKLLNDDYAYSAGGNIYFDTSKLDNYYRLTNQSDDDLLSGVRDTVEEDDNKKNKTDFVLWFTKSKFNEQELKWDSPFGEGYPGWHIECSGISLKFMGEYIDVHCGGVDNIIPHHTNEIAQSESYLGHKWCKYWVHGEHLNDDTGKMSKSKGKTLTISVLEENGYNPLGYKFLCLMSHYRNQLVFNYNSLDGAENAYKKLKRKVLALNNEGTLDEISFEKFNSKFKEFISDDLNTASTITLIYDILKSDINDYTKYKLIESFEKVLNLDLLIEEIKDIDTKYIEEMIEKRNAAKKDKNYDLADSIRKELLEKGIMLNDTREGTKYEVI